MQWHMSNAVFRPHESGVSFQTGGPVISRVSRVKTATVTITATNTSQTAILNSASSVSLSTVDTPTPTASSMFSATSTSIATTVTATTPSTAEITVQPTSTDTTPTAPQVSVPVNTLVAIIGGTIGGILFLVFLIAVAQAFMRRRHIIEQETQSPGGASNTLEKGSTPGGQRQYHVNDGNIDIPHPSPSARSELSIAQRDQAAYIVSAANFRTWPAVQELHPRQVIAELPSESHARHSLYDHRG
ncbi:hypothetical protein LY78DRAFT_717016 [Colletotrichum sublineola]|uniref:Uncharacterized protein n=1 Tax=Colletotrichum sublineola TaxID=1173701 RepID=A0A066WYC2_COLSU|nr:hypothetical protein LY78DRAFT_717016 [Colletotrichum sublineola]KDN60429.1 hypothetical protein CSUB01_00535 [Colletotrichum sublineola]